VLNRLSTGKTLPFTFLLSPFGGNKLNYKNVPVKISISGIKPGTLKRRRTYSNAWYLVAMLTPRDSRIGMNSYQAQLKKLFYAEFRK
jgi:hypothetical protein